MLSRNNNFNVDGPVASMRCTNPNCGKVRQVYRDFYDSRNEDEDNFVCRDLNFFDCGTEYFNIEMMKTMML